MGVSRLFLTPFLSPHVGTVPSSLVLTLKSMLCQISNQRWTNSKTNKLVAKMKPNKENFNF